MVRIIFTLLVFVSFWSCNPSEQTKSKDIVFFYYSPNQDETGIDTFFYGKKYHHNLQDSLLYSYDFKFKNKVHTIKIYTSEFYAPTDGGSLFYELDSLGVIYSRSTTWYRYHRLKSNNDSLNLIIDIALEQIILRDELNWRNSILEITKFTPPEVEDEK